MPINGRLHRIDLHSHMNVFKGAYLFSHATPASLGLLARGECRAYALPHTPFYYPPISHALPSPPSVPNGGDGLLNSSAYGFASNGIDTLNHALEPLTSPLNNPTFYPARMLAPAHIPHAHTSRVSMYASRRVQARSPSTCAIGRRRLPVRAWFAAARAVTT